MLITLLAVLLALLVVTSFYTVSYFNTRKNAVVGELKKDKKIEKYEYLLSNFNEIALNTIYLGAADYNGKEETRVFTAFSLYYKENFYIITAGHSIDFEDIKYENFKVKAINREIWFYPELLYYNNDLENNDDFAIFKNEYIKKGLYPSEDNTIPEFVVGNASKLSKNILKRYENDLDALYGESGSPILDDKCRVVGVLIKSTGEYTEISKILDVIDQLQ